MPDLPVLLATGYSEELLKTDHDFMVLAKPYDGKSLVEAMAAALSGRPALSRRSATAGSPPSPSARRPSPLASDT